MVEEPRIIAMGTANPSFRYSQREIYDVSRRFVPAYANPRIEQIFMSSDIDFRHLAIDFSSFTPEESADDMHRRFEEHSVKLAVTAACRALDDGKVAGSDIDYVIAVSCTGYLCPGLSALLIKEMGLRRNVQRADLIGMGCAGAMPGLQRGFEYVKAYPERKALVVAVEVCSACYYVDDSLETVVGNAICADGAAAVVIGNHGAGKGPTIVRFETLIDPDLIHTVGFQFREGKLRIILSKDIRGIAGKLAHELLTNIVTNAGISREDIRHWVIHSGGRKVIDAIKTEVGLTETQLSSSRTVLRNYGNMSSPTVLFVLQETMRQSSPREGEYGFMLAMGPGLAVEGAIVRW